MKILFWNVRGLGEKKRRGQLKELIDKNRVDIFCLHETMKREFSISELRGWMETPISLGIGLLSMGTQEVP
jgi:exonuclease III